MLDGKPIGVILDIDDIKELKEMKKKPLKFKYLDDFLKDKSLTE